MELLSNLVWIAVAFALWWQWLLQRRTAPRMLLASGIRGQFVALALLTLILLPVISVSDDLQASHNPAEVERTSVRNDQHLLRPDFPTPAPAALAVIITCLLLASPHTIALLRPSFLPRGERTELVHSRFSRPPPIA